MPMAETRRLLSPVNVAAFMATPRDSNTERYSAVDSHSTVTSLASSMCLFDVSFRGAAELPQLPLKTVVTPWRTTLSASGFTSSEKSLWLWTSIIPGDTTRPSASTTSSKSPGSRFPTRVILSPLMATSPVNQGLPVPSTTLPFLINTS